MPDLTPNNPGNVPKNTFGPDDNTNSEYELITAYIDNEIKDTKERDRVKNLIDSKPEYYNRYIFEKLSKETLKNKTRRIETPAYLYTNIGNAITDMIKKAENNSVGSVNKDAISDIYTRQLTMEKSNLRRYLTYGGIALIALVVFAFIFNNYLQKNPQLTDNDLVSVSRKVFDRIESGEVKLQFKSDNAKDLADSMNKYLDFKVFVPDVSDATLEGGVCNEQNGEKLAHIIHKKNGTIIYTLQANMKDIMNNKEKIILCPEFKENVTSGKNWFECTKDKDRTAVIWYKDNVICSSVAHLDSHDISKTLTSYKK